MKFLIINGPNLNLLGVREKSVYGHVSFESYLDTLIEKYGGRHELFYYQSNLEGEIINRLHEDGFGNVDGIILNAGGYTHTSVAIADAIAAINVPVVEVHISNVHAREDFRHVSLLAKNCKGVISGFGLMSYDLGIHSFLV
jgi:3-dehydroquinate dehydratase II